MADNTVFDSVFKTIVHKTPQLMVPFINEAFNRSYPADAPITQFSNEHEGLRGTTIDDSVFRLMDKIYHVECQSTPDTNMVIRMIEYDFSIALEQALAAGKPYEMEFPASCVLFLRHNTATPSTLEIKVNLPSGESFMYQTKVVKAQTYSSDELFGKHLLLLLPYYLMRYEDSFGVIANDNIRTAQLVEECVELNARLANAVLDSGDRLLYEQLVELIIKVSDHVLSKYTTLQGKVRNAMGGEVLELMNDRAERLAREAKDQGYKDGIKLGVQQGIEQGIEQGVQQGIEQGIEQGIDGIASQLKERGVDDSLVEAAIKAFYETRKAQESPEC